MPTRRSHLISIIFFALCSYSLCGIGRPIAPLPVVPSRTEAKPGFATDGQNLLSAWSKGGIAYAIHRSDGTSIRSPLVLASDDGINWVKAAFNGTDYLVVWNRWRSLENDIAFLRVSRDGTLITPPRHLVRGTYSPAALSWNGNFFALSLSSVAGSDLRLILDAEGNVISSTEVQSEGDAIAEAYENESRPISVAPASASDLLEVVSTAGGNVALFQERGTGIVHALNQQTGAEFVISSAPPDERTPSIVTDGTSHFAVWIEFETAQPDRLVSAMISPDPLHRQPTSAHSESDARFNDQAMTGQRIVIAEKIYDFATACDGRDFLIVWTAVDGVHLQRVSTAGVVRERDRLIAESPNAQDVSINANGAETLVVWTAGNRQSGVRVHGALLRNDAIYPLGRLSPEIPPAPGWAMTVDDSPRLSWRRDQWVLVWDALFRQPFPTVIPEGPPPGQTAALRIKRSGALIDERPINVPRGSVIGSSPDDSLLVWIEGNEGELRGTRMGVDGNLIDGMRGFPIDTWNAGWIADELTEPTVIWSGNSYVVTWQRKYQHLRTDSLAMTEVVENHAGGIRVIPPREFRAIAEPAVAVSSRGERVIVASEKQPEEPFFGSYLATVLSLRDFVPAIWSPRPPANVRATYQGGTIDISWTDSSDNEDAFIVAIPSVYPRSVAFPAGTDSVSYPLYEFPWQFDKPVVRVWSYNAAGRSEIVEVVAQPAP